MSEKTKIEDVIREALKDDPQDVFIMTLPKDGGEPQYFSSFADCAIGIFWLQNFIHKTFNGDYR